MEGLERIARAAVAFQGRGLLRTQLLQEHEVGIELADPARQFLRLGPTVPGVEADQGDLSRGWRWAFCQRPDQRGPVFPGPERECERVERGSQWAPPPGMDQETGQERRRCQRPAMEDEGERPRMASEEESQRPRSGEGQPEKVESGSRQARSGSAGCRGWRTHRSRCRARLYRPAICATLRMFASGSLNHATRVPSEKVMIPRSSWPGRPKRSQGTPACPRRVTAASMSGTFQPSTV